MSVPVFQFSDSDSAQLEMRLLYERVPHHYTPDLGQLDNPIVKYIQVFNTSLDVKYTISDLPKGKYIMCAQIMDNGQVFRSECIDFIIERPVTHSKFSNNLFTTYLLLIVTNYSRTANWSCRLNLNLHRIRGRGRILLYSSRSEEQRGKVY